MTKEEYSQVGSEALLQQLAGELKKQGKKPYCIPVGGSSPLGCWGYLEAVREIQEQAEGLGITDVALVSLHSLSSCRTTSGSAYLTKLDQGTICGAESITTLLAGQHESGQTCASLAHAF